MCSSTYPEPDRAAAASASDIMRSRSDSSFLPLLLLLCGHTHARTILFANNLRRLNFDENNLLPKDFPTKATPICFSLPR